MDSSTRMSTSGGRHGNQLYAPKYLWIRLALFDKKLSSIIDYLADNNRQVFAMVFAGFVHNYGIFSHELSL